MFVLIRRILLYGLLFLLFQIDGYAQPRKGCLMVSPAYGFTGKKIENKQDEPETLLNSTDGAGVKDELLSVGFSPRIGYLFTKRIAAGVSIKYGRKILRDDDRRLRLLTTGPFFRYYLTYRKIAPYLEAEGGAGRFSERITPESGDEALAGKSSVYYFSGGGGVELFLIPNFSFDLGINYKKTFENYKYPSDSEDVSIGNVGIRAGLSLYLSMKDLTRKREKPGKSWI